MYMRQSPMNKNPTTIKSKKMGAYVSRLCPVLNCPSCHLYFTLRYRFSFIPDVGQGIQKGRSVSPPVGKTPVKGTSVCRAGCINTRPT